jgi:large subunit ribosomal protein L4
MLLPLKNIAGDQVGEIELSDAIFAAPVSKPLMHQALMRQLSNARLGTHKTKNRGEVAGGGRKPFRQKGTGRARQGSIRASQWVGGGTAFGPIPRKYIKQLPKKMNAAAIRSALTVKAAADQIVVVDTLPFETPKTKAMVQALRALGVTGDSVLMVLAEKSVGVLRSASNLPNVKTILSGYLNIRDLLGYDKVLLSKDALEYVELWLTPSSKAVEGDEQVEEVEEAEVVGDADGAPEETEG